MQLVNDNDDDANFSIKNIFIALFVYKCKYTKL
jgi:hypothetical protein